MSDTRPVNLDLMTIKLPVTAYASIIHRVCAVITWVALGPLLVIVCMASASALDFNKVSNAIAGNFIYQFCLWGFLSAFGYYCIGTTKHLLHDFGFFENKESGKLIASIALGLGIVFALIAGVYIWA